MLRIGKFRRPGPGLSSWPVLLCFTIGVLLPSSALLWFMSKAIQNERLAMSQKLLESYRGQMPFLQQELQYFWSSISNRAAALPAQGRPAEQFDAVVESGLAHGAIVLSPEGFVLYPDTPRIAELAVTGMPAWQNATGLEREGKLREAAGVYAEIGEGPGEVCERAPALLAQARCLQQLGELPEARQALQRLTKDEFSECLDPHGRLISPNAELALLELMSGSEPEYQEIASGLASRLRENSHLSSSQRRFLMRELETIAPEFKFERLEAEEISAGYLSSGGNFPEAGVPGHGKVVAFRCANLVLLFEPGRLRSEIESSLQARVPEDLRVSLTLPGEEIPGEALAAASAALGLPNWKVALLLRDPAMLEQGTHEQVSAYIWTGVLVLAAMGVITLLASRLLARQFRVARLKNDLVANVTHELKTPLASTRLLVDTLLQQENPDPTMTREYLELIARENSRLSRLVENFLAFSRMERGKHSFRFEKTDPGTIARSAAEALQEKLALPSCSFHLSVEPELPPIQADAESLATAIINLLDNALKYSGEPKRITLRVHAREQLVSFEVQDNGFGIPPGDRKKIFRRFYQAHRSPATQGCGLGLSIVQFIIRAHDGEIQVESRAGEGSTFRILLPALSFEPEPARKEALT